MGSTLFKEGQQDIASEQLDDLRFREN